MTDRELLELAAKAAGIEYTYRNGCDDALELVKPRGFQIYWNPLADDGDALRLAVQLGLILNLSPRRDCRGQTVVTYHGFCKIEEPCHEGREAASRRAIVRAAAEIGKGME